MTSDTGSVPDERRHDLDALRAAAMLLGLVYHASLSFAEGMPWLVRDDRQTGFFYGFQAAVHGFRMPLFFLISGFFTAMLWRKRGLKELVRHRVRRILLPCLLGLATVVPAMWVTSSLALASGAKKGVDGLRQSSDANLSSAVYAGKMDALERQLAGGADPDAMEPVLGVTPLVLAAMKGDVAMGTRLLDAGARLETPTRDGSTPLHAAAFLGRTQFVDLLLARGANVQARNPQGYSALDAAERDWRTTEFITGMLRLSVDRSEVERGRTAIVARLVQLGLERGPARPPAAPTEAAPKTGHGIVRALIDTPVFTMVWFLWVLCWLVALFVVYAIVMQRMGWRNPPAWFGGSAMGLWIMVPLTALPQAFMEGSSGGFGPDTSMGILPMPRVLLYYALFFFFGALHYEVPKADDQLGRRWRLFLALALGVVFPAAFESATGSFGVRDALLPTWTHRPAGAVLQSLYAWMMAIGCIGLFRSVLTREDSRIRYLSDASYWLYLAHLPLVVVLQVAVRDWPLPAWLKCTGIAVVVTLVLLGVYDKAVRYTWLGRLLNGPRTRPGRVT